MAKLTFYGAVEGVTGSAYLLQTARVKILLDCGLYQGRREEEKQNQDNFPFDIDKLDAVVLSHAHLDHSGRLPKLAADGYSGSIYMTYPTAELLEVLLKDSASLQRRDAEWENKRRRRSGKELSRYIPLKMLRRRYHNVLEVIMDNVVQLPKVSMCVFGMQVISSAHPLSKFLLQKMG